MEDINLKKDNDSKKILTLIILIGVLMVTTTGATYAYFALTVTPNNTITGTAATAGLTLNVTQAALKTGNTGVMVPQLESALGTAMNSTNKCVDANGNVICRVYTITLTNNSSATVKVKGTITFSNSTTMPNLKWRKTTNATTLGTGTAAAANVSTAQVLENEKQLAKDAVATYYIVIWINETGDIQTDSGTFRATVAFNSSNGTGITSTITGS